MPATPPPCAAGAAADTFGLRVCSDRSGGGPLFGGGGSLLLLPALSAALVDTLAAPSLGGAAAGGGDGGGRVGRPIEAVPPAGFGFRSFGGLVVAAPAADADAPWAVIAAMHDE